MRWLSCASRPFLKASTASGDLEVTVISPPAGFAGAAWSCWDGALGAAPGAAGVALASGLGAGCAASSFVQASASSAAANSDSFFMVLSLRRHLYPRAGWLSTIWNRQEMSVTMRAFMSFVYPDAYDVIVVGAGHAGCEAALAAARMGRQTLVLTGNLEMIAQMSCNPAIGGVAKGHLVKEIDALGGEMARVIDETGIQFRRLNTGKGPAVRSTRAQADKRRYRERMRGALEACPLLRVRQAEVAELLVDEGQVRGVRTTFGVVFRARAVILTTGTFLRGLIHVGDE